MTRPTNGTKPSRIDLLLAKADRIMNLLGVPRPCDACLGSRLIEVFPGAKAVKACAACAGTGVASGHQKVTA